MLVWLVEVASRLTEMSDVGTDAGCDVLMLVVMSDAGTDAGAVEGTSSVHVRQVLREQAKVGVHRSRVHRLLRGTTFCCALFHLFDK